MEENNQTNYSSWDENPTTSTDKNSYKTIRTANGSEETMKIFGKVYILRQGLFNYVFPCKDACRVYELKTMGIFTRLLMTLCWIFWAFAVMFFIWFNKKELNKIKMKYALLFLIPLVTWFFIKRFGIEAKKAYTKAYGETPKYFNPISDKIEEV